MAEEQGFSLQKLYQPNPHTRAAAGAGQMMPQAGLAAPGLAYVMGREMGRAKAFDEDKAMQMAASKAMETAFAMADQDPLMANQILEVEAQANPYAKEMADTFKFAGKGMNGFKYIQVGNTAGWFNSNAAGKEIQDLTAANNGEQPSGEEMTALLKKHYNPIVDAQTGSKLKVTNIIEGSGKQTVAIDESTGDIIKRYGTAGTGTSPKGGSGKVRDSTTIGESITANTKHIAQIIGGEGIMAAIANANPDNENALLQYMGDLSKEKRELAKENWKLHAEYLQEFRTKVGREWGSNPRGQQTRSDIPRAPRQAAPAGAGAPAGTTAPTDDKTLEAAIGAAGITSAKAAVSFLMEKHGMGKPEAEAWVRQRMGN